MQPTLVNGSLGLKISLGLAFLAAVCLIEPIDRIPTHVPRDYNEGWNAYHAEAAVRGVLYPPPGSWAPVNYPPLSFEVLGALGGSHDLIQVGRLIALVSLAAVTMLVFAVSRRLGATASAAATGAVWLLAVHAGYFQGYVAMNDPQWLGHALGMVGLLLVLIGTSSSAWLAAVAISLVAAGLVKHNLLPLPLAITAWLLIGRPRAAIRWLAIAVLILAIAIVACRLRYGAAFFDNVLGTELHRPWSIRAMRTMGRAALPALAAGAAAVLYLVRRPGGTAGTRLIVIYAGASLAWGAFTAGGLGVGVNAFFDLSIATALALAVAFDSAASRWRRAVPLLVLCAPVLVLPARVESLRTWRATREAQVSEARDDVARIAAAKDTVLCETLALCYWAGKPIEMDLFSARLTLQRVPASRNELFARFTRREFGLIQVESPRSLSYFLPGAADHLRDGYVVDHTCPISGILFVRVAAKSDTRGRGPPAPDG